MSKFRTIKNSFSAGQISPTAFARTDTPQYAQACKTLKNMIPFLSGGVYRRPGTEYINRNTAGMPKLIPFVVSKEEAYCIAIYPIFPGVSSGFIEAYRVTTNFVAPTQGTVTLTNAIPYQMASDVNGFTYDELTDVQYIQSADVMWIVHPNYSPYILTRTSTDNFTFQKYYTPAGAGAALRDVVPFMEQNATAITMAVAATTGNSVAFTASAAYFTSKHVGAWFKLISGGVAGYGLITTVTDSTHAHIQIFQTMPTTSAITTWAEGEFSDERGWPRSVSLYADRLIFGGTKFHPDSIFCSQTANYNVFSQELEISPHSAPTGGQPFTIDLLSLQLNQIQWLARGKNLTVGTLGEEWDIKPVPDTSGVLNFARNYHTLELVSSNGSAYRQAIRIDAELFYSPLSGDKINSIVYNLYDQSFNSLPLQTLFDEYPKIEESNLSTNHHYRTFVWDNTRDTLWCCDTLGNFFGLTHHRQLQFNAWHVHELGGRDSFAWDGTGIDIGSGHIATDPQYYTPDGRVVSIAAVPNPLIGTNDIWLAVRRYSHSDSKWQIYIERMSGKNFGYESAYLKTSFFLDLFTDCATKATRNPVNDGDTVTGFSNLEGRALTGTAGASNGLFKITGTAVVAGSSTVNLSGLPKTPATYYTSLGLQFDSIVEPVRIDAGSVIGTAQSGKKRIHELTIRVYRTILARVGRDENTLELIIFKDASVPTGESAELFTGDKIVKFNGDYDRDGLVYIVQKDPLPFAIQGVIAEGMTYDG